MDKKKPSNIIYGVSENPPFWITLGQGFQHVCTYAIALMFPVIIVRAIGGSVREASFVVSMSMIAGGIGAIVQAFSRGPVGSGYLCPQLCGPSFLTASILAAKTGGLSLVIGMTAIAGMFEALFSKLIRRLRPLFPPEITGLIVALVGISVIRFAITGFLGLGGSDDTTETNELVVAVLTLGLMVGFNIWSKGKLKLFCVLAGMIGGYVAAYALGIIDSAQFKEMGDCPLVWLPILEHPGWSFDLYLLIPFIVAMLCSSLKSVGDLTTCQRVNDAEWKRSDMNNISKGILAGSIGCMAAGILGGMGQSTSSTNIGLSIATGITSRVVAYAMGSFLIILGFFPKISTVFAIMPKPIMGATVIFAISFMIMAGLQIIMSRMIDARKTFIVGISLIFGLSVDLMPEAFVHLHPFIDPIFSSSLSTGTITAIILNLVFRIGIAKKVAIELAPEIGSSERIVDFMEKNGALWGAIKEVISRSISATNEFLEAAVEHKLTDGDINMKVSFDEFNLDVDLYYSGKLIDFPAHRPDMAKVLDSKEEQLRLSFFLMKEHSDKISATTKAGHAHIHLHFEH
jgi:NCS2 family nucleobase:cation symporter-2